MSLYRLISFAGVAAIAVAAFAVAHAEARIQGQGNFQVTKHGLIATPYCEEEQIARVAQSYGWKVTAQEVHKNPLKKVRICQMLGGDTRLKGSCAGYAPELSTRDQAGPSAATIASRPSVRAAGPG